MHAARGSMPVYQTMSELATGEPAARCARASSIRAAGTPLGGPLYRAQEAAVCELPPRASQRAATRRRAMAFIRE